ncbi:MAG: TetR/AcrR family transcriptional regulator [Caldilineaceae bacterium]|nr:TetR/AcrR family transcriptional regulator [Caldilineaceae bacterium]
MAKSDNPERESRILDAAAALFIHFGVDKTTVSDIARDAGISKGAIYLHFQSKDELLEALLRRELKTYAETWLRLLDADPQGGTIGGMYKNMLYALSGSDFMAAMFRQDGRVLGSYLRKPGNLLLSGQMNRARRLEFVRMMQEAGAIRQDIDAGVIAHIMNMLLYSLVAMNVVPDDETPPTADVIEGIAVLMDSALVPADGVVRDIGKEVVQQIADAARQRSILKGNHND